MTNFDNASHIRQRYANNCECILYGFLDSKDPAISQYQFQIRCAFLLLMKFSYTTRMAIGILTISFATLNNVIKLIYVGPTWVHRWHKDAGYWNHHCKRFVLQVSTWKIWLEFWLWALASTNIKYSPELFWVYDHVSDSFQCVFIMRNGTSLLPSYKTLQGL